MADGEGAGHVLTAKVGPLPLVLWVVGGASVIFVVMLMRNKGSSGAQANQTNAVTALAPTEAEAFGTLEQQQQDVTNALTTLGNNQSALGGSMSTLTGIVTQQGSDNAAAFQNLVNGQNTIEAGQTSAANTASYYQNTVLANMLSYFNSLGSQINGVNSNVSAQGANLSAGQTWLANVQTAYYNALQNALSGISGQVSGVSGQVSGVSNQVSSGQQLSSDQLNSIGRFLGWQFYQLPNRYTATIPTNLNPPGFQ